MVVIGVGNAWRGDDAVGLEAVHVLRGKLPAEVRLRHSEGEPMRMLEDWHGAAALLLVDAVQTGTAPPGTVHRIDLNEGELPTALFQGSTHHFSIGDAVELARTMRRLPPQAVLIGIEAACFVTGSGLTAEVEAAVPEAVDQILAEVDVRLKDSAS